MKKKRQGHYCKVCGERKANEKFSGKGHATHICKACSKLSVSQRNEQQRINRIVGIGIGMNFFIPKEKLGLLKKYAGDKRYPEAAQYAKDMLDDFNGCGHDCENGYMEDDQFEETVTFEQLDNEDREIFQNGMYEAIEEFILCVGYIPEKTHKEVIIEDIYGEICLEDGRQLIPCKKTDTLFDSILQSVINDLRQEGIEPESYMNTLTIFETERLTIRKFIRDDFPALHAIMEKEEVMYAWEHGFTKSETRKWLNRQLTRYKKDGYGYYAVILKETGDLIGQAGPLKNEIEGKEAVEIGYIFDNRYWKQGYCIEAVKGCIRYAQDILGIKELYCTVRPENEASVRIAEKAGMKKVGEEIKIYKEKEMLHFIYRL
jgi:RimJ/RimL family protein N-acetyltransferase